MCNAGVVTVTVRNWINANADADKKMTYNCMACTNDCTPAAASTDATAASIGAAVVAKTVGVMNLSGSGT